MKKEKFIILDNQLGFSLYKASRKIIRLYKPFIDKYGLTYTQYIVMLVLWEEEKITVKGLGKRLQLDSGTLTPLLKKLENMNLILRYRDMNDDRVVIVELTEKGMLLKGDIVEVPNQVSTKIKISEEKIELLKEYLDELLKNI